MENTNYNKLLNNLEELKLTALKENLPVYADMVSNKEKSFIEAMYELTDCYAYKKMSKYEYC